MTTNSDETPLPEIKEEAHGNNQDSADTQPVRVQKSHPVAVKMSDPRTRHAHSYSRPSGPHRSEGSYARTNDPVRAQKARAVAREEEELLPPVYARVLLDTVNPWTVMKTSFLVSFFTGFVIIGLFYSTWLVVQHFGLVEQLNTLIATVTTGDESTSLDISDFIDTTRVITLGLVTAVVNVALMTLGGFFLAIFYNVTSHLVGGVTVRLTQS